jgi:hypothetical protein
VLHDFVCALRHFRGNALLTATVVTCLAIGIGASTAAFSVIDAGSILK